MAKFLMCLLQRRRIARCRFPAMCASPTCLTSESVLLRVNDRGPFHPDRLIDLSYGAAKQLGFAEQGTALVRVESIDLAGVDDRRASAALTYRYLQLGAYRVTRHGRSGRQGSYRSLGLSGDDQSGGCRGQTTAPRQSGTVCRPASAGARAHCPDGRWS